MEGLFLCPLLSSCLPRTQSELFIRGVREALQQGTCPELAQGGLQGKPAAGGRGSPGSAPRPLPHLPPGSRPSVYSRAFAELRPYANHKKHRERTPRPRPCARCRLEFLTQAREENGRTTRGRHLALRVVAGGDPESQARVPTKRRKGTSTPEPHNLKLRTQVPRAQRTARL